MKNSSIKAIQKQLSNGFKTIVSFGKHIQVTLTSSQIEKLQNQLRIARLLEPKQLWESVKLVDILAPQVSDMIVPFNEKWVKVKVQGTYNYMLNGELNVD